MTAFFIWLLVIAAGGAYGAKPEHTLSLTMSATMTRSADVAVQGAERLARPSSVLSVQLTACQAAAQRTRNQAGAYVPQCSPIDGSYEPKQCHPSTGQCWCVDRWGTELAGTRQYQWVTTTVCNAPKPQTPCQAAAEAAQKASRGVGAYIPQCSPVDGSYVPKQCQGASCWCVTQAGNEVANTRHEPWVTNVDCTRPPKPLTACQAAADAVQRDIASRGGRIVGAYIPQCNPVDGSYMPKQCHGSTAECWCVDQWGTEIAGTRQFQWVTTTVCTAPKPLTPCQAAADAALKRIAAQGGRLVGVFVPQCDPVDGSYVPKQCHEGFCWCVTQAGVEIPYTRHQPSTVNMYCSRGVTALGHRTLVASAGAAPQTMSAIAEAPVLALALAAFVCGMLFTVAALGVAVIRRRLVRPAPLEDLEMSIDVPLAADIA